MSDVFNRMKLATRFSTVFGAILAIFVIVVAVAGYSARQLAEAERWNTHTHKVMNLAQDNLASMINMETGARGFLLAGQDAFLEPWTGGQTGFGTSWDTLKKLTADNLAQQRRLDEMQQRRNEFVTVGDSLIQARRAAKFADGSMEAFFGEFAKGRDQAAMDGYRALNKPFYDAERELLVVRAEQARQSHGAMSTA